MVKPPNKWTPEEDRVLHQQVTTARENGKSKNWTTIAACLPGRTNKDCRKRWYNHLVDGIRKGSWSSDEDERLVKAVYRHGQQWSLVSEEVGTRNGDQCAKRWNQTLDPALDRSSWSQEEQKTLLKAVIDHGRSWKQIQIMYFPERATNNVKNRYVTLTKGETIAVDQILSQIAKSADEAGCSENSPAESIRVFDVSSDYSSTPSSLPMSEESIDSGQPSSSEVVPIMDSLQMDMDVDNYFNIDPFFEDYDLTAIHKRPETSSTAQSASCSDSRQQCIAKFVLDSRPLAGGDCRFDLSATESTMQSSELSTPPPREDKGQQKFVISIDEPSPEMVRDIMGLLVTTKARFKSEMQHGVE